MDNRMIWLVVALAAAWFFFLRKKTTITGGANLGIATGNNASPYPGYPPNYLPPGVQPGAYGGPGPRAPQPIIMQGPASGDSTQGILTGIGQLFGGLGSAAGNVLTGLGNSGLLGGGGDTSGSYDVSNYDSSSSGDF